jgi:ribonuclease Z
MMGPDCDRDGAPIDVYGPEGLRMWLRVAIRYSVSRVVPPYRVHELMDVPMAPEWEPWGSYNMRWKYRPSKQQKKVWGSQGLAGEDPTSWISRAPMMNLEPSSAYGEVEGGRYVPNNFT